MDVEIKSIPQSRQRDPNSVGDYWRAADGALYVRVTEMPDWRYELLIAVHELIEEALATHRGIPEPEIMRFDLEHPELDDPGMDCRAPYHAEHFFADAIERLIAQQLGVDWHAYGEACEVAVARHAADDQAPALPRPSGT